MFMSYSHRRGFTLTEAVLVIVIASLIVAILLPTIQKARSAAARLQCGNHLKEVGQAFQSHHTMHGRFPYGGMHVFPANWPTRADPNAVCPKDRSTSWSWAYQLLPHLGQHDLYQNNDPHVIRTTPIKCFYCPARRSMELVNGLAKIDYAGNAGSMCDGANGVVMQTPLGALRGIDIPDGLASTVLIGEKQMNTAAFGMSRDDDEAYCTPGWNDDWEVYRWGASQPARDYHDPAELHMPRRAFGSAHATGFNVVFCDGSLRHIRYTVDPLIWKRACVRNDNEEYNPNNL